MFNEHRADIVLKYIRQILSDFVQGYMSAIYPSSVFNSIVFCVFVFLDVRLGLLGLGTRQVVLRRLSLACIRYRDYNYRIKYTPDILVIEINQTGNSSIIRIGKWKRNDQSVTASSKSAFNQNLVVAVRFMHSYDN